MPTITVSLDGTSAQTQIALQAPAASPLPYDPASAWNVPVGAAPTIDVNSAAWISLLSGKGALTSDPTQFTPSVVIFDSTKQPNVSVSVENYFSTFDAGDNSRVGHGFGAVQQIPLPAGVQPPGPPGGDGQVILYDPKAGVEYGLWRFVPGSGSTLPSCTNAWRYHTGPGYYGRMVNSGRGAGTPYLAGLVRPWEIAQGHIDHALAFACSVTASGFVYPATKSDGSTSGGIPEGTRLQLDPKYGPSDFAAWGLNPIAQIVAKALQIFGMFLVDGSGRTKIYLESTVTATWDPSVTSSLVSGIPWSAFRVVDTPVGPT